MNEAIGDLLVPLYFILGSLSILFLAYKFLTQKASAYKNFGLGLLLYGTAFAIWAVIVLTKPDDIATWTTIGAIPFGFAHLFYLMAAADKLAVSKKSMLFLGAGAYLAVLFIFRTFLYESNPGFSEEGLFYFNPDPVVVALYIGAFAGSVLPAINTVATKMKDKTLSFLTRLGFTTLTIGSVVLVTSHDDTLQLINGFIMGAAFLLLVSTYARRPIK